MDLARTTRRDGADTVVSVTGDVDNATAGTLRDTLIAELDDGAQRVVVDLSDTDFLDSSGLGALVAVNKHVQRLDRALAIVCPRPQLRRLFAISRLDTVLPIFDDLAATDGTGASPGPTPPHPAS